jgi:hypothetical protein
MRIRNSQDREKTAEQETGQEDRRKVIAGVGASHIFGAVGFSMDALSM